MVYVTVIGLGCMIYYAGGIQAFIEDWIKIVKYFSDVKMIKQIKSDEQFANQFGSDF